MHITEIRPVKGWIAINFRELWQFRSLILIFFWRDLKVRYKQTTLGFAWLVLQPLSMAVIYSIFFGYIAKISAGTIPYPVFVLSGIVVWQFFLRAVNEGSTSLSAQQALIGKIYFPRLIAPLVALVGAFFDFLVMFIVLIFVMLFFGVYPSIKIIFVPFFIFGMGCVALGLSLFLTGFDAIYRDVRHALGFAMQVWYFSSPIIYPVELVPEKYQTLYLLNPATPFIQGFRWAVLEGPSAPPLWSIGFACVMTTFGLLIGLAVFQRMERNIVDRI